MASNGVKVDGTNLTMSIITWMAMPREGKTGLDANGCVTISGLDLFAFLSGLSKSTINRAMSGGTVSKETVARLCATLGTTPHTFVDVQSMRGEKQKGCCCEKDNK